MSVWHSVDKRLQRRWVTQRHSTGQETKLFGSKKSPVRIRPPRPAESRAAAADSVRSIVADSAAVRGVGPSFANLMAYPILKVMTMRLEAFGGWRGVLERLVRREDLSGDEAVAALAARLRSLGFDKVTVVFEQPPAT